jgi:hypothetical protein
LSSLKKMTMINDNSLDESTTAFWLTHPDPTQAAVHLALQWLAHVYPTSEKHIDRILNSALPYSDSDLSSRWAQFLEQQDVENHIDALEWIADTLTEQQMPFLLETCWRLLLIDHELPTQVPLAFRILGRIVDVDDSQLMAFGTAVFNEYTEDGSEPIRVPLVPIDPRYLDRIEWRLYGHSATHRRTSSPVEHKSEKNRSSLYSFAGGTLFGALLLGGLVFGPLQIGRLKVPMMLHDGFLIESQPESGSPAVNTISANTASLTDGALEPEPADTLITSIETASSLAAANEPELTEAPAIPVDSANTVTGSKESMPSSVVEEPEAGVLEPVTMVVVESAVLASPVTEAAVVSSTVEDISVVTEGAILASQPTETAPSVQWLGSRVLMEVTASILNVRREPLADSPVLIKLATGARVWAYPGQTGGQWMAVKVEGETGYASARFLAEVDLP